MPLATPQITNPVESTTMNCPATSLRSTRPGGNTRRLRHLRHSALAAGLALALPAAMATTTIDWLSYAPTPTTGFTAPAQTTYPASSSPYGAVSLSYTPVSGGTITGVNTPTTMANGSIASNAYAWGTVENFGRTVTQTTDPLNQNWSVTYSFANPMQSGQSLFLGIGGLGKRDANAAEPPGVKASIVNVTSPGSFTFLGEYDNSNQYAPTTSTILNNTTLTASLRAENSLSAPGGLNPNWNTMWAVYEYKALGTVGSITFDVDQTRGDGLGLNIGFTAPVPEPHTYGLMALGLAMLGFKLRRRSGAAGS
jgi:hypothetical protein